MRPFGSRRRLVNRRRRHSWLTPRGRAVLVGSIGLLVGVGLAGSASWPDWIRFEERSASVELAETAASDAALGEVGSPSPPLPVPDQLAAIVGPIDPDPNSPEIETLPAEPPAAPAVSAHPPEHASSPLDASSESGPFFDPPRSRDRFEHARPQADTSEAAEEGALATGARLVEWRDPAEGGVTVATPGRVRVEYSLDEALTERVFKIMRRGRVSQGHAIVLDPRSGRLLAYVSTDEETLPADKAYPAASIVKILTASAVLESGRSVTDTPCLYRGNKYRLSRRRLERPKNGREATLETALATSNNQCFAQWAIHSVGETRLRETFDRFGWLSSPAPGHEIGALEPLETDLDLGRLGSGLDGVRVTPMHVAQIASILTHGEWVEPWWIDRVVDGYGRPLRVAPRRPNRRVLSTKIADRLRSMLVATTKRGTAKSAFRDRRGRPRIGPVDVAGKTGNLTGWNPYGRYEWFLGLAPAEDPQIAVVVLQLQGHMWWKRSTELASDVLRAVFCDKKGCGRDRADRLTENLGVPAVPLLISDLGQPSFIARAE